jgi:hypothetical protein
MKNIKKTSAVTALILAASLGVSACSKAPNPLLQVSERDAGVFLANASQYAQKKLKWDRDTYGSGGGYGVCMTKTAPSANCQTLYKTMLVFAKEQQAYKTLTVSELTDRQTFEKLKEDYQGAKFELLPE